MRYFTYLAERSFKTAPGGERVFYLSGPWSRPYIMPDAATEQRLYRKQVWMLRITLGAVILVLPVVFLMFPNVVQNSLYFLAGVAAISALSWLAGRLLFARDVKGLRRLETRLSLKVFYGDIAGPRGLILGLAGCLIFVAIGVWMLMSGQATAVALVNIVFFGLCGIAWTYAIFVRRTKAASAHDGAPPI